MKDKIRAIILSKLVVDNKQSIHLAVDEIAELMDKEMCKAWQEGAADAQNDAAREIQKNYQPIKS